LARSVLEQAIEEANMLSKILVPVDFSECGAAALDMARGLAVSGGAELVLLHVEELPLEPTSGSAIIPSHVVEARKSAAEQRLLALRQQLLDGGLRARSRLELGPVFSTILEVAEQEKPTLIVMGTNGRRGLKHALLGSVAERIVRTSPVPVMTVKLDTGKARSAGG
jgi:nucleotide-binding universal stress UspA family protein